MKTQSVNYWINIILSGKDYEPRTAESLARYQIAEYMVSQKKEKLAA